MKPGQALKMVVRSIGASKARTALVKYPFQSINPVGTSVTIAGNPFTVIGVYAAKDPNSEYSMDNMAVELESANRTLNKNEPITSYIVRAKFSSTVQKAIRD